MAGDLLHIGSDAVYEPDALHGAANSVLLVDVAERLLHQAASSSPRARAIRTSAQDLTGIAPHSVDTVIALRVFSSAHFDAGSAVERIATVLRNSGSALLSFSNGYRALDDTILPGQIAHSPAVLNLSTPFRQAATTLALLHRARFRELFLTLGTTEIFVGGTYLPGSIPDGPNLVLHCDNHDDVPLCFYSPLMPTAWLGNYSQHAVHLDGYTWPTVEHYYQSHKFPSGSLRTLVRESVSPEGAKRLAWDNTAEVRPDWPERREAVMRRALHAKFQQHPHLSRVLFSTQRRQLVERSPQDTYWGRALTSHGLNRMGALLMQLRSRLGKGGDT